MGARVRDSFNVPLENRHRASFQNGTSLQSFLEPETGLFWTNSRQQRLHIRVWEPLEIFPSTAVIVIAHGFGSHLNSARGIGCLEKYAESLDAIMFVYDHHGHGFSEGERGLIQKWKHLADDLVDFVQLLYNTPQASSDNYNLCSAACLDEVQRRPLVLAGESVGGGVALAATVRLQASDICPQALLLFAPFLKAYVPFGASTSFTSAVQSLPLKNLSLPSMLIPNLRGEDIFANEIDVKIFEMDRSKDVKASLGWSKQMNAGTAASIVAMCDALKDLMPQLETPVLVCHDPNDTISKIEGSERLNELARCSQLCKIPGGLHAPHFNKQVEVGDLCRKFLSQHLGCRAPAEMAETGSASNSNSNNGVNGINGINGINGPNDSTLQHGTFQVPTAPSAVAVSLQHLKLERPAFERFPLPGRVYETVVLMLYFAILMGIASSPTLVALAAGPEPGGWLVLAFAIYLQLVAMIVVVNYARAILKLRRTRYRAQPPLNSVPFAILIPMYNEDVEVLQTGLESINSQPQAHNVTVIIGFEERAGKEGNAKREKAVREIFSNVKAVHIFTHPAKVPGHIKGCGSNQSWAMNQFLQGTQEDISDWVFMKVDAQVVMQPGLLTELEHRIVAWREHRRPTVWQPLVLHTINNDRAFAVGSLYAQTVELFVIGIFGQPLISLFLFGQYAMPMDQYVRAGMHHPSVMAEDQAITIQAAWTNRSLSVQPLDHAVAKAPPLGDNVCEAIGETLAQDTRFFVGSVLILPWNLLHNPSTLSCCSFVLNSLFLRHFTTVAMPIMSLQSMFTVGFGLVKVPVERLEEAVNGVIAVFNLVGPTVTLLMAVAFAILQFGMISQWPGKAGQHSCRMIVGRILWMPTLQILIFTAEVRAFLLCIFYGSNGQHGPLQYRARKKMAGARPPPATLQIDEPVRSPKEPDEPRDQHNHCSDEEALPFSV